MFREVSLRESFFEFFRKGGVRLAGIAGDVGVGGDTHAEEPGENGSEVLQAMEWGNGTRDAEGEAVFSFGMGANPLFSVVSRNAELREALILVDAVGDEQEVFAAVAQQTFEKVLPQVFGNGDKVITFFPESGDEATLREC